MTLSAAANLERRIKQIEAGQAARYKAITLLRSPRGLLDGLTNDLVICYQGKRYPCDAATLNHFEAAGVRVEMPQPLAKIARKPETLATAFHDADDEPTGPQELGQHFLPIEAPKPPRPLTEHEAWRAKMLGADKAAAHTSKVQPT